MARRTGPSNPITSGLINELKLASSKNKAAIWKRIASELSRPARQRRVVTLFNINKHTKANDLIVVPGKVVGNDALKHKINIAAFSFSDKAKELINKNGKAMSIPELLKTKPDGSGVKIIG